MGDRDPAPAAAPAPGAPAPSAATGAGRGVLYIAFAKFYFMFAGLFVQFRLPGILTRTAFGSYSLVAGIASFVNNVVVTGTIQTVSRFAAQQPERARQVQAAGLRMHVALGLPIAIGFIALAPVVSHYVLRDPDKTEPLMLAGLIVGGYSFYAVFVGTANGLREFHKQAGLDVSFATLRVAGLIGMAMAGFGVVGMIGGWVAAVGVILCASAAWIGLPRHTERIPVAPLVRFFVGVAVYLTLFNALMFVDSILIKRFTSIHFDAHARELAASVDAVPWLARVTGYHVDSSALADVQNAYYAAVQNIARVSYQAIIAATFVVFPLVSRSTFTDDRDTTRSYIRVTSRYALIFATAIATVTVANPADILGLVYAPDYVAKGATALIPLAIGNVAFSVFAINGTILNGAGLSRAAIAVAALTLALSLVGNWIAIPIAAERGMVLEVAASVSGGAMVVGAAVSGFVLYRRFGAFLPVISAIRIVAAAAVAVAVGHALPLHGKLMTLVEGAVVGVSFLAVLVVTRELGKRDLDAIRAIRKKRGTGDQA